MWDMSLGGSPGPPQDEDFRMKLGGLVVVASNAGGAWTPIGDITTTMLYIGGQALLKEVHPNDEKQQGKAQSEQNGEHMWLLMAGLFWPLTSTEKGKDRVSET